MRQFAMGLLVGLFLLPSLFLVTALSGWLPTNGTATPPAWETAVARHALHAAVAREAGHPRDPIAPTEANLRAGMKLFRDDCAGCHGAPDQKTDEGLYPRAPRFADHTPKAPVEQLFWIVKNGVHYSGMFAFGGGWKKDSTGHDPSDEKIWTVVTFLHSLDSLPPAVAADWRVVPRD
jgi:thiosulfate dehydrogenase